MAIRNQHSRQSRNYIIETINGVQFYIQAATYQSKSLIYQAKNKIENGKLNIPNDLINSGKTILIICEGKGNYQFSLI